jgi:O-antigen/teichoic acid export membrane protein
MRRLLKFLHTMGALGMTGSMAALAVMLVMAPPPSALAEYAAFRSAMAAIANWLFMPSLGVTLIAGLLALAASPVFHNAGWAWLKAVSGVLLFESGFVGLVGPMQREAEFSAQALNGAFDAASLGTTLHAEKMTIYILLAIATANVVLGVWRPILLKRRMEQAPPG